MSWTIYHPVGHLDVEPHGVVHLGDELNYSLKVLQVLSLEVEDTDPHL